MRPDVGELEAFYATRQGQLARRLLARGLRQLWPDLRGQRVLGLGYPLPLLTGLEEAERRIALLPPPDGNGTGRLLAAETGGGRAAVAREDDLPLADGSVDRVLLVHALESCPKPARLLREVWRVLADGGRLVAVVPNRRGLWALSDRTPFGHGQPYSSGQLSRRLTSQLFEPLAERGALYLPPFGSRLLSRLAVPAERLGLGLASQFGGVVLVEAEKRIYLGTPLPLAAERGAVARRRRYVAAPVAAASRGLAAAARRPALLPPATAEHHASPHHPPRDLPRAA